MITHVIVGDIQPIIFRSSFFIMNSKLLFFFLAVFTITACSQPGSQHSEMGDKHDEMGGNHMEMKDEHMDHGSDLQASDTERLIDSPRHHEWVEISNGDKKISTWVVYPEVDEKRPVVLLIHENRGLNDWARSMADQVAEAGYIAVAPDLLSEFSDSEKTTRDFADEDEARTALSQLDPEGVISDLKAVSQWAKSIPSANGKLVSAGFCWGGARSFEFATESNELDAVLVFYGTGPTDSSVYEQIDAPVFGFYGGADERVNATIPDSEANMTAAGKSYEYEIYEGAGHAFMRSGESLEGEPANVAARNAAFERMKSILSEL